jgi:hypothetical protein
VTIIKIILMGLAIPFRHMAVAVGQLQYHDIPEIAIAEKHGETAYDQERISRHRVHGLDSLAGCAPTSRSQDNRHL